jgi:hypothetical protein
LTTLQESQRTAYPNDLPVKGYDFQAPLGEFGQMNAHLRKLKLVHYFLNDFGAELAPAVVVEPNQRPTGPEDRSVLRASARFNGVRGFIFVNNYIREHEMRSWPEAQLELNVSGEILLVPETPITVPANSYFYWPINMDFDGVSLRYATAQPILKTHFGGDTYVFFRANSGIPAEFAFPTEYRHALHAMRGVLTAEAGLLRFHDVEPGLSVAMTIHGAHGNTFIVLLSEEDADNLWRVSIDGKDRLLLTNAQVFNDGQHLILHQIDNPIFGVSLFPAVHVRTGKHSIPQAKGMRQGIFQHFVWKVQDRKVSVESSQTKAFGKPPEPLLGAKAPWRKSGVAMAPEESSFQQAGQWRIQVPRGAMNGLSNVLLAIKYQGDEARLLIDNQLLTDNFYNGTEWRIGLKRFLSERSASAFDLQVLPLANGTRIFFEPGLAPTFGEAHPEYELNLSLAD